MPTCPKCLEFKFDPPQETWDKDSDGLCLLHSRVKDKNREGAFTALIEEKKKREDFNFAGVFFPEDVFFLCFNFTKEAHFTGARFAEDVHFVGATFSGYADFYTATFSANAFFMESTFSEKAVFTKATFSGYANSFRANFKDKARVELVEINAVAKSGKPIPCQPWQGDLGGLKIAPDAMLIIKKCNLSKVKFAGSDLTRIEFDRVTWARWRGRDAVYNELE